MQAIATSQDQGNAGADLCPDTLATYRAALEAFVARRVNDADEVQDLVQEACARLVLSARNRQLQEPQAYLFRIAANLIVDRHRRIAGERPLEDADEPMMRADQEDARNYVDLREALEAALAELPPRCREVFVMRRFDEMSTAAVAFRLRITPRMVQKHLVRAVAHLYDRLGPIWSER